MGKIHEFLAQKKKKFIRKLEHLPRAFWSEAGAEGSLLQIRNLQLGLSQKIRLPGFVLLWTKFKDCCFKPVSTLFCSRTVVVITDDTIWIQMKSIYAMVSHVLNHNTCHLILSHSIQIRPNLPTWHKDTFTDGSLAIQIYLGRFKWWFVMTGDDLWWFVYQTGGQAESE